MKARALTQKVSLFMWFKDQLLSILWSDISLRWQKTEANALYEDITDILI